MKKQCPLFIPICLYIAGILFWSFKPFTIFQILVILSVSIILYFTPYFVKFRSLSLLITFFFLGLSNPSISNWSDSRSHFSRIDADSIDVFIKEKQKTRNGNRYIVKAKLCHGKTSSFCKGKLLVSTDTSTSLEIFNTYRIKGRIYKIEEYKNPDRFDYGKYLGKQNINYRLALYSEPTVTKKANKLLRYIRSTRTNALGHFQSKLRSRESSILISAMLLGDKTDMSSELKTLFTNNGLAHILAISGMHVGIILIIMNILVQRIPSRTFKTILIILGIWFYIFLTGLQIPAARAGLMFSIYTIGHILGRNTSALNSVFLSALILLSIDFHLVFQLSFQLSYMAMLSILLFYNYFLKLFNPTKKHLTLLWQIFSLNLSVQVLVLPICIFYFHQIPMYSIFNSIISTPFILLIMWSASASLLFSKFDYLNNLINIVLEETIGIYLATIDLLSKLPYALLENIEINIYELTSYTLCVLIMLFLVKKYNIKVQLGLACFIPVIIASSCSNFLDHIERKITIYDDPKQIIIDFQEGKNQLRLKQDLSRFSYQVESNQDSVDTYQLPNFFNVDNLSFAIIEDSLEKIQTSKFDFCIVKKVPKNRKQLQACRHIILPRNTNDTLSDIKHYSIKESGAYIFKL